MRKQLRCADIWENACIGTIKNIKGIKNYHYEDGDLVVTFSNGFTDHYPCGTNVSAKAAVSSVNMYLRLMHANPTSTAKTIEEYLEEKKAKIKAIIAEYEGGIRYE